MAELQEFQVRLSNGLKGTVLRTSRLLDKREFNTVKLSNGKQITVPSSNLELQDDGNFYLREEQPRAMAQPESVPQPDSVQRSSERHVAPERHSDVDSSPSKQHQANIDAPVSGENYADPGTSLFKEDVDLERVPINRVLEAPADVRIENGVTIIPVMEEIMIVTKQLVLKEEIRITRCREQSHYHETVSLRAEEVEVRRSEPGSSNGQ